ncbi:4Fe-4S dicluster domain-containing protein [Draconibacterium sediminis]|uniref:4Fe-4S dicluster domain-containing protein n=1 Tax=Draconibacterium sediminis TaxID=1544798 RepID=UPI0005D3A64D|nr:4Fe-4S dicluster domain-containing protein [Draconibacterium sediminis]
MTETKGNRDRDSRRKFLRNFGAAGTSLLIAGCSTKESNAKSGEKIKVLNQNQQLVEVDVSDISPATMQADKKYLKKKGRTGIPGRKFVMVVDLAKCKNARQCMKACQGAHQLKPEQHHINVLEMEDEKSNSTYFMPKPCQHCDNPSCVTVCPVDATFKRSDGIVLIDNERCIGCRFCIAACPYSARTFNWTEPRDAEKYKDVPYDMELNVPQKKGTVTKCAFSADRVREGKLPYCVSACPNGVYYFGDENQDLVTNGTTRETVRLSHLLEDNAAYTLMPELGTKPRVYYLPPRKS